MLFLDADEWLPEAAKLEISALIARTPVENGFYINRRLIWMGHWIRRGYYPSWILRLFRHGQGRCEDRTVNEHIIVRGATAPIEQRFHARGSERRDRLDRQAQPLRDARGHGVVERPFLAELSGDRRPSVRSPVAAQAMAALEGLEPDAALVRPFAYFSTGLS